MALFWSRFVWLAALLLLLSPGLSWSYGVVPKSNQETFHSSTDGKDYSTMQAALGYVRARAESQCANSAGGPDNYVCAETVEPTCTRTSAISWVCQNGYKALRNQNGALVTYFPIGDSGDINVIPGCPENAGPYQQNCSCLQGFKPNAQNKCVANSCSEVASGLAGFSLSWSGKSQTTCYRGCELFAPMIGYSNSTNKSTSGDVPPISTGKYCEGQNITTGSNADTQPDILCPTKQCPGMVNGVTVCVACSETAAAGPTSSASGPSAQLPPPAPAGAVTSNDDTSCSGTKCTTTTTYRDGNGSVVGTQQKTQEQASFCEQNKASPLCKSSVACSKFVSCTCH